MDPRSSTASSHHDSADRRHVDVLVIGAGLSGIGAACQLVRKTPDKTFAIIERRKAIGGTWDLFKYPGIRSDSDMFTFGYGFRPWTGTKVLADGPSIRNYVEDTAREFGVIDRIQFGRKVVSANFSTSRQQWIVVVEDEETRSRETWTASFVIGATGYYNHDEGYRPSFPGEDDFQGKIVHPQHWPADLDYKGKQVVVIGSGATAVTLVPAMAKDAAHVTMLQRTPTYILSVPSNDFVSAGLRRFMPASAVYRIGRARNIGLQQALYRSARTQPGMVRRMVLTDAKRRLGSKVDVKHFSPSYEPWDQRLCVVPDGDLFRTLRHGRASIVTDRIRRFTPTGIELESGRHIPADIIVTATGLNIQMFGGTAVSVDGQPVEINNKVTYKGSMIEGVPNAIMIFGYTNASWTLKADLVTEYFCRLLKHMDSKGHGSFVVHATDADRADDSIMGGLESGYIHRANHLLPRQGARAPFKVLNDYLRDVPMMRFGGVTDDCLEFIPAVRRASGAQVVSRSKARKSPEHLTAV